MVDKHVIVVGAGPGGLAGGMLLASRGFKVTILEKNEDVGGRNGAIRLNGFKFDVGPTFLMMKFMLDELFEECGKDVYKYLEFRRLEPMYHINIENFDVYPTSDRGAMKKEVSTKFKGNEPGLERFYKSEKERFAHIFSLLRKDYSSVTGLASPDVVTSIPSLSFGRSLYDNLSGYFDDDRLRLSFTFQAKYLGMSPWECPGAFAIIPYVEHNYGIYHVMGGLCEIPKAMAKAFAEMGGTIRLNAVVKKLIVEGKKVKGVELESGEKVYADEVIVNSDFAYSMSKLVPEGELKKYSLPELKKKRYSCSTFMLYLGLDKLYELPHHNIVFAKDYRKNIDDIFHGKKISDDMSIYIQNASITDPTLAPAGKSAVYVLVPVTNNEAGIDWDKVKDEYKELILDTLEKKTDMKDLRKHIEAIKVITPKDWENEYNVFYGATFNLAHNLGQMLYWRPHNRFEELDNCYLAGGGTHPGSGLPTIYESARISSNLISKKYGVPYRTPGPAPSN